MGIEPHRLRGISRGDTAGCVTPKQRGDELTAPNVKFGITATQIRSTVYAFPTFSADIKSMV